MRWDIFCNVVDHFGDIGVSWRLARQLAAEHRCDVRLWVDDLDTFRRLCPELDPHSRIQTVGDIDVRRWEGGDTAEPDADGVGDVVVEAFGSRVPAAWMATMAARDRKPVWINLEYLSAEDWVEGCHRMTSPHPRLPLVKHFFFPGFTAGTGGLLREHDLEQQREQALQAREPRAGNVITVSLFGYGGPAVGALLAAWVHSPEPVLALVPESVLLADVAAFFGGAAAKVGDRFERGALSALVLPFQSQPQYDRLLWSCDCNFVRGEDSFVRAQWAERPFVWNIYPQAGGAHWAKLHAFHERYCSGLSAEAAVAVREFWRQWNLKEPPAPALATAWRRFWTHRTEIEKWGHEWALSQAAHGDLASNLVSFASERL